MTAYIEISGGTPLSGSVRVSGAKNGALPLLISSLLASEPVTLSNIPNLEDISVLLQLLEHFGAETDRSILDPGTSEVKLCVPSITSTEASYSLVKALRASFWVLAPLLARAGEAHVALPGGDIIGARPVDIHLDALAQMGADIDIRHGVVIAKAKGGLKGAEIDFRFPSVGATHQIVMAASLARGTTVINGAACEPEVVALADFINLIGGEIEGAGSPTIIIKGKSQLGGGKFEILGDRIEAATYILAAIASRGQAKVSGFNPLHLGGFLDVLTQMGVSLQQGSDELIVSCPTPPTGVSVITRPFPGFATDIQALLMACLCTAYGDSTIEETMFEGRFGHVSELCRMGSKIQVTDRIVKIQGVERLTGAPVEAFDIRAAAGLVIAALGAEGSTQIFEPQHLRRGYAALEQKLSALGARIGHRISDPEDYMFTGC